MKHNAVALFKQAQQLIHNDASHLYIRIQLSLTTYKSTRHCLSRRLSIRDRYNLRVDLRSPPKANKVSSLIISRAAKHSIEKFRHCEATRFGGIDTNPTRIL